MSIITHGAHGRINTTFQGTSGNPTGADLEVAVHDTLVRKHPQFGDHDGFEKPFALVPYAHGSHFHWEKHYLTYDRTDHGGTDMFKLHLDNIDQGAVNWNGVAFGMELNNGSKTAWLQGHGDNAFPGQN